MIAPGRARVLIVEDEVLLSLHLGAMLEQMGFLDVVSAPSIARARDLIGASPDIALLDVNLGQGMVIFPFASELRTRRIPLIFCSSVERGQLPLEWRPYPCASKPIEYERLRAVLEQIGVVF